MLELIRYTVFGVFVVTTGIAVGAWAVRTRRVSPFSKLAQLIRRTTDPLLKPVERAVVRRGGNPQNAEWWMLGSVVVGGIVVVSLASFLQVELQQLLRAGRRGPFGLIRIIVYYAGRIVTFAILVRVIGSWLGAGRYSKFMKPVYALTDWIIEPLRRVVPPLGMFDISPIIAFFLVQIIVALIAGF